MNLRFIDREIPAKTVQILQFWNGVHGWTDAPGFVAEDK